METFPISWLQNSMGLQQGQQLFDTFFQRLLYVVFLFRDKP